MSNLSSGFFSYLTNSFSLVKRSTLTPDPEEENENAEGVKDKRQNQERVGEKQRVQGLFRNKGVNRGWVGVEFTVCPITFLLLYNVE